MAVLCLGCNDATFVPTEADVRHRFAEFIPSDASRVGGVVRYNDIDAMLAWYCAPPSPHHLDVADRTAVAKGWSIERKESAFRRYVRFAKPSYEVVQIRSASNGCTALAWVQADGETPETFPDSPQGKWAAGFMVQSDELSETLATKGAP